jgi:hypothetical protein
MRNYLIIGAVLGLASPPAIGAEHEYRTVTWFVEHPTAMAGVLKLCRDNAGLARHNPNCTNADEASIIVTQRELGSLPEASPLTARYWAARPAERKAQIGLCDMQDRSHGVTAGPMGDSLARRICNAARGGD